jgi:hypothetical protein
MTHILDALVLMTAIQLAYPGSGGGRGVRSCRAYSSMKAQHVKTFLRRCHAAGGILRETARPGNPGTL